jgi:hypothetical protein
MRVSCRSYMTFSSYDVEAALIGIPPPADSQLTKKT